MRKLLLLLSFITLLAACQKETIDSKRICALWNADAITPGKASALLGITEPMPDEEYYKRMSEQTGVNTDWHKLWNFCHHYLVKRDF